MPDSSTNSNIKKILINFARKVSRNVYFITYINARMYGNRKSS